MMAAACSSERTETRIASPRLPQVSGALVLGGISAPVRVVRDRWGVPHIEAQNQDDLFFAQGFVQAQDRLFQMDLWRRSGQGRLSEVLGPNFVERDVMTRRIQYRGDIEADWASYGPDTKAIANAFVRGINAWVQMAHDPFPEEFVLAGWAPELWRAEDLLNRTDAFVAGADAQDEVFRARLAAAVGAARASSLLGVPLTVSRAVDVGGIRPIVGDILRRVGAPPFFLGLAAPVGGAGPREAAPAAGSNAWAIARSDRGAPLLAGDPHRLLENPSSRYLVHLRAPGWNVIGATAPWLPGVAIGHNERVAWSLTSSRVDVQDLYVEKLNPANPHQVLQDGGWIDVAVEKDAVAVKGRQDPFEYDRLSTPRGVIVAIDRELDVAYALRWTGTEPGTAAELAAVSIDRARSAVEFRTALARWKLPAADFVYADVDGRVGRQLAALLPDRSGWRGALPVAAHQGGYEWNGWIAAHRLPGHVEPKTGVVVTANESRARLNRIASVLEDRQARGIDGFKRLQNDVMSWNAEQVVPLLARVRTDSSASEDAKQRLLRWDRRLATSSSETSLYVRWEDALVRGLVAGRIPPELRDEYTARAGSTLVSSLAAPSRPWFDGDPIRQRDALLVAALNDAAGAAGNSPGTAVTFVHPLAVTEAARRRFNVGPFVLPGRADTVFAIGAAGFGRHVGPSFRAIMDAGDWDRSVATNPPGQSGSPASPHFSDLSGSWAAGEYFPLPFSETSIRESAETTLMLVPR
jgi:penicillin amidase